MSTPEVRVRLSPEGVNEVLAALRKAQSEGKKANESQRGALAGLRGELAGLKRLLPAIGLAAAVTGLAALSRQALKTADDMGKLAQRTGASTENLSVLVREAELGDATLQDVQNTLTGLGTNLEKLRRGEDGAVEAFANLNLSAQDFIGLDTVEAANKVGTALANLEDPTRRAALAKETLGRAGVALIPTLVELADKGFANAADEAARLGLVIDDDLATAAAAVNDNFTVITQQVRGLALQFVSGLAPAVSQAMAQFTEDTGGKGVEAVQKWGRITGRAIGAIINLFRLLAGVVGGTFEIIGNHIAANFAVLNQVVRGNFSEALAIVRENAETQAQLITDTFVGAIEDAKKLASDLANDPPEIKARVRVTPEIEGGDIGAEGDTNALRRARIDAAKKQLAAELALQKEANDRLLDENERAFERGLQSLAQYTERRREIIERQAAAEIAALQAQRAALAASAPSGTGQQAEAERLKITTEIGEIDSDIRLRQLELARELADVEADRFDKQEDLTDELRAQANTLDELEGRRHDVFLRNLEDEIKLIRELGTRAGETAEQIEASVARLTSARSARFDFDEAQRAGSAALDAFNRDAELIRRDAEAGITSQLEGERRLIDLQRQRLAVLQQLAAAALAAAQATGDPEIIAQAQQYADSVAQVATSYETAANASQMLRSAAIDSFQQGLAGLLENLPKIESLEDAFRSLAQTVTSTIAKIAAELLARKAVLALLGSLGGGAGAAGGGGAGGLGEVLGGLFGQRGGLVAAARYAMGGTIGGPELPIPGPDKVPIVAQKGEFMMRRARVAEPGALAFLHAWNAGRFRLGDVMGRPRFAEGGAIGAVSATPSADPASTKGGDRLRIVNVVDEKLVQDALGSAAGERVLLNVIDRNASALRSKLLGG